MHIHGPLLIFAGAGSGKTRVITHRIRFMIYKKIPASQIVAVSFTNKSSKEMKERLKGMMKRKELRGIVVSTFHSLGNKILHKEIHRLPGYRYPFSILSQEDATGMLTDIYRTLKLDTSKVKEDGIGFHISLCKNSGLTPIKYAEQRYQQYDADLFEDIFNRYHKYLVSTNSVDFDDLIILPRVILESDPEVMHKYRKKWKYFLIDEFQDTNPTQFAFLNALIGAENNICVVGDDDQSIYGWRGADINIIMGFQDTFPGAKTVRLEYNYRSKETILKAANAVIKLNSKRVQKMLKATKPGGEKLVQIILPDDEQEAIDVAERIHRMTIREKRRPGDFAILYRTNFQSRAFEQELRKRNIPHYVVGGYKFFDRREVKDMIAYLRVLANPKDELSLKRIINRPRRGVGEGTLQKVNEYILGFEDEEERPDFNETLLRMMEEPGLLKGVKPATLANLNEMLDMFERYRKEFLQATKPSFVLANFIKELKWEMEFEKDGDKETLVTARMLNIGELVNMLAYFEEKKAESGGEGKQPLLYDFLAQIAMLSAGNDEETPAGRVNLMTMHVAKGLEYPCVFLTGMEQGLFPSQRSLEDATDAEGALEEERRLFYVGITRAQEELFLTGCASRKKFGETISVEPSQFLDELPAELVEVQGDVMTSDDNPENPLTELLAGLQAMGTG